jgi:hypothetical protein
MRYEPNKDPERRTEVGGPPSGLAARADRSNIAGQPSPPPRTPPGRRPAIWVALAVVLAASFGLATWRLKQPPGTPGEDPPGPGNRRFAEPQGTLDLDSFPAGAIVTIDDRVWGPTPQKIPVSSRTKIQVKLNLKGFQPYEDDLVVEPGKTIVVHPRLLPAPAMLHVETTPPGATVTLGHQPLGTTPLTKQVNATKDAELAIARTGYEPIKLEVNLPAGEQTSIARELKELPKFGVVFVFVNGSAEWGYVSFKGKNLGQNYTMARGQTPFRLPVGRQKIQIAHPRAPSKIVTVDVNASSPTQITVTL